LIKVRHGSRAPKLRFLFEITKLGNIFYRGGKATLPFATTPYLDRIGIRSGIEALLICTKSLIEPVDIDFSLQNISLSKLTAL
jgi:hypothetical protein